MPWGLAGRAQAAAAAAAVVAAAHLAHGATCRTHAGCSVAWRPSRRHVLSCAHHGQVAWVPHQHGCAGQARRFLPAASLLAVLLNFGIQSTPSYAPHSYLPFPQVCDADGPHSGHGAVSGAGHPGGCKPARCCIRSRAGSHTAGVKVCFRATLHSILFLGTKRRITHQLPHLPYGASQGHGGENNVCP